MAHNQETKFMNAVEQARALSPGRTGRFFVWTLIALVVSFVVWASIFQIDELTRGSGQVVPSQEMQIIQSLEGGLLKELLVREGDKVEEGDILLRISDVAFASEARGGEARLTALKLKQKRLEAEISGEKFDPEISDDPRISNEVALFNSRQEELQNNISIFQDRKEKVISDRTANTAHIEKENKNFKLLGQELKASRKMAESGAFSKLELVRLERRYNEAESSLKAAEEKDVGLAAEIRSLDLEAEQKRDMFRTQALGELGEVKTQIIGLEESLKSIGDVVDRTALRAPVSGIVNTITVKTIGGVIEPAKPLIEIVPLDEDLKIIARVSPNDIAFIQMDQNVKVRISAYDPQRYGHLEGKLVRIGASTMQDKDGNVFFEVEVVTDKNYLGDSARPLPVTPGMLAEIDIITGRKTILSYLLKPVLRLKDRAFRER